ncbi:MAG: zinc-ribbon domain-containing protein [Defluviitaleaceae bacterium]|nr:zinc-ribbon domain-containing protein [Defluviitaleaceae bacterium]
MFCAHCGTRIDDPKAAFCPECGTPTEVEFDPVLDLAPVESIDSEYAPEPIPTPASAPTEDVPDSGYYLHPEHSPYPAPTVRATPSLALGKKQFAIIGVAAMAIIILVIVFVFAGRRSPLVGTWEDTADSRWRIHMTFNRNGTGTIYELDSNTGMIEDEEHFRWVMSRDFGDMVRFEFVNPFNPLDVERVLFDFEINRNFLGEDILTLVEIGGWGDGEHFRRVN